MENTANEKEIQNPADKKGSQEDEHVNAKAHEGK